MAAINNSITIHGSVSPDDTKGYDPEVLATTASDKEKLSEHWNAIVDQLSEWGLDSSVVDEDGLVFPSGKSCAAACKLVIYMKEQGWSLPTGVIIDGEGGIVFENRQDPSYQRFEIDKSGRIILFTFHDCKFRSQHNVVL